MNYLNSTETDVAYHILSEKGEPVYYKDLVTEVIEKKAKPVQSLSRAISEVYTLINMDSRFHYTGKGYWGLTRGEQTGARGSRRFVRRGSDKIIAPSGEAPGEYSRELIRQK